MDLSPISFYAVYACPLSSNLVSQSYKMKTCVTINSLYNLYPCHLLGVRSQHPIVRWKMIKKDLILLVKK